MALWAAGRASGSASKLRAPAVSFLAPPPDRDAAGMRHSIRGKWQVSLRIPFPKDVQSVVFLTIAF